MHMMYRSWVLILWLLPNYKLECTSKYNSQQFGCNTWMLMVDVISWYCQWWKTCGSTGYEVLTQTSTYPSFFYNSGITIHIAYTMYILLTVHLYFTTLSTTRLLVIWSYAAASAPQTPTPTPQGVRPQPHTVPDPSNPYVRIYIYIHSTTYIWPIYYLYFGLYFPTGKKQKKTTSLPPTCYSSGTQRHLSLPAFTAQHRFVRWVAGSGSCEADVQYMGETLLDVLWPKELFFHDPKSTQLIWQNYQVSFCTPSNKNKTVLNIPSLLVCMLVSIY